ncbi:MAG: hypothetical protein ACRCV6_05385 [Formosimonas sp.]
MTLRHLLHFNIAAGLAFSGWAQAQEMCAHFKALPVTAHTWFIVNEGADSAAQLTQQTLPILPADERNLWSLGSRILTRWPAGTAQPTDFVIVRSRPIKTSTYQGAVGFMLERIGHAQSTPSGALRVTGAAREITPQDRLLPAECLKDSTPQASTNSLPTKLEAKPLAFVDETAYIGTRGTLMLIDHGEQTGVAAGQTWAIVEQLPAQPASAQTIGHAVVLQTVANMSVVRIIDSTREVRLSHMLRYAP